MSQLASAIQAAPPTELRQDLALYPNVRLQAISLTDTDFINTIAYRDAQLAGRDLQLASLLSTISTRIQTIWGTPLYQAAIESFPITGYNIYQQPFAASVPAGSVTIQLPNICVRPGTFSIIGSGFTAFDDGEGTIVPDGPITSGTILYGAGTLNLVFATAQLDLLTTYVYDFWVLFSNNDLPGGVPGSPPFDPGYLSGLNYPIDETGIDQILCERDRAIYAVLLQYSSFLKRLNLTDPSQAALISDVIIPPLLNPIQVTDVWSAAGGIPELIYPASSDAWSTLAINRADMGLAWRDNLLANWAASIINLWDVSCRWLNLANRIHIRKIAPPLVSGISDGMGGAIAAPGGVLADVLEPTYSFETLHGLLTDSSGSFIYDSSGNALFDSENTPGVRYQDGQQATETLHLASINPNGRSWQSEIATDSRAGLSYDLIQHAVEPADLYQDRQLPSSVATQAFTGNTEQQQFWQLVPVMPPADDLTEIADKAARLSAVGFVSESLNGRLWAEAPTDTAQDVLGMPDPLNGVQFWGQDPCIVANNASLRLLNVVNNIDQKPGTYYQFGIIYLAAPNLVRPGYQNDPTSQGQTAQTDGSTLLIASPVTNIIGAIQNIPSLVWNLLLPAGQWQVTLTTSALPADTRWSIWLNSVLINQAAPATGATSLVFNFNWTGGVASILTNLDIGPAGISVISFAISQLSCSLGQPIAAQFQITLENESSGLILAAPLANSDIALTDRLGNFITVPQANPAWVPATWNAFPNNQGYMLTEAGVPITTETGVPISLDLPSVVSNVTPELELTQSLPLRYDVYLSGVYAGSDLVGPGAYSLRLDWLSNVITPIQVLGYSVRILKPGDPVAQQCYRAKDRYAKQALNVLVRAWDHISANSLNVTPINSSTAAFGLSKMYTWLADLAGLVPSISDAVRPSLPTDLGVPCIIPSSLTWSLAGGVQVTYSAIGFTPRLAVLQPWMINVGAVVLKEMFWDVPTAPLVTPTTS